MSAVKFETHRLDKGVREKGETIEMTLTVRPRSCAARKFRWLLRSKLGLARRIGWQTEAVYR